MGLSASQARLLSITARLTDNEYQSQQITNAKLRLSVQQTEAMAEYTRALNEPDLCYNIFDSQGNVISTDFTMAAIYDYAPNKNQYAVKNSAGRILVAGKEAENYEQTGSLVDFLDKYDLIERKEIKTTERRMQEFQEDNPDWVNYREAHGQWELREPEEQIVISSKDAWTERIHNSGLYQLAMETGCIEFALQGLNCYMHVLASMLGPGEHTTSSGVTYTIYDGWCHDEEDREITDGTGHSYIEEGHTSQQWCWNTDQHPADETLKNALKEMQCCGEHEHNETVDIKDKYGNIKTDIETKAFECNQNMTVYQKLVDLLWEVHWDYDIPDVQGTGGNADPTHLAYFWHFIEFDLDKAEIKHHDAEVTYGDNPAYYEWLEEEPQEPDTPETITVEREVAVEVTKEKIVVNDPEKAQWYTNLWYSMNGQSEMIKIQERDNGVLTGDGAEYEEDEWYLGPDTMKKCESQNYKVIDPTLYTSKSWLVNSLKNGNVTLENANVSKSSYNKLTWNTIVYTNAPEISESDDSKAIAKAQAEYEAATAEINAKDKKYQRKLNLLDAEHHALQTEYDSVKSAYEKNVTRSFKVFQG